VFEGENPPALAVGSIKIRREGTRVAGRDVPDLRDPVPVSCLLC
jgi:hypothetical protein